MNHDEPKFEKQKFSVAQKCPKCGQLSLLFKSKKIICTNCGYGQDIPLLK